MTGADDLKSRVFRQSNVCRFSMCHKLLPICYLIFMLTNTLKDMESFFMALADKTRLRLLNLMRDGEVCVCFFTEVLGESQPKVSRHLAYLRSAGVVEARRDGKWMHYRIVTPDDSGKADVLDEVLRWLDSDEQMRRDYANLAAACCAPAAPITIMRAPKPETFSETAAVPRSEPAEIETYLL